MVQGTPDASHPHQTDTCQWHRREDAFPQVRDNHRLFATIAVFLKTWFVSIYTRGHTIIEDLIQEAKKQYEAEIDSRTCIHVADQYQNFYMAGP